MFNQPKLFPLEHKRDCEQFDVHEFTGYLGDLMLRCQDCGAIGVASLTRDYTHGTTETAPAVPLVTSYYCRAHYNPVTPKGTGCPKCTNENRKKDRR